MSAGVEFFLSRIALANPPRDPHALHKALWKAFPDGERSFLFRTERPGPETGQRVMRVLVQSRSEARWHALGKHLVSTEQKQVSLLLAAGVHLRFLLRANPTRRVHRKTLEHETHQRTGPRVGLRTEEERRSWLDRKGVGAGFRVLACTTENVRPWRWTFGGTTARHDGVDYEGNLEVTDAGRLVDAVLAGIGPAKAFGFGLLSLAPLRR